MFVHASLCITSETLQKTSFRNGWGDEIKCKNLVTPVLSLSTESSVADGGGWEGKNLPSADTSLNIYMKNYFCETL